MDEECQKEDDEDEDCDKLPVVDPLDMHDAVWPGHHILTAPNAPQTQLMSVYVARVPVPPGHWSPPALSFSRDNFPGVSDPSAAWPGPRLGHRYLGPVLMRHNSENTKPRKQIRIVTRDQKDA